MDKLFRQVSVKERLPEKDGEYLTNRGLLYFDANDVEFFGRDLCISVDYWLEEVELPSEDEIYEASPYEQYKYDVAFEAGAQYILNKLKAEKSHG